MFPYIEKISIENINDVLVDIEINIPKSVSENDFSPVHLVLTGKNGSGKTMLLNSLFEYFKYHHHHYTPKFSIAPKLEEYGFVSPSNSKTFFSSFYKANRLPDFQQPNSPSIPDLQLRSLDENKSSIFLEFLANLKVQRSLQRDEGNLETANKIDEWFAKFDQLLKRLFADPEATLEFTPQNYTFHILAQGRRAPMTALSDGYKALLDIISDMIIKMQEPDNLISAYEKPGIVLIDEVETHLHLQLQAEVMPMLTTLFPKVQFIISTHSPFVLNSMENAVVYDLENKEAITDMEYYPYDAIAEGYFGAKGQSSYLKNKIEELEQLAQKENKNTQEQESIKAILTELDKIPMFLNPNLKTTINQIKITYDL